MSFVLSSLAAAITAATFAAPDAPRTLTFAEGTEAPPATIADVAWIAGDWTCEALGGTAEEFWQEPNAGVMIASFRMIRDDKPSFYELATIAEYEGSLVCRIVHFDANLVGWEKEKEGPQEFPLVKIEPRKAFFDGLTFEDKADGGMDVWVRIHGKDGTSKEALFAYRPIGAAYPSPKTTTSARTK